MNLFYILDKDKNVVPSKDVMEWASFVEDENNRIVAFDSVGKFDVSTIFLGLRSFYSIDAFETVVIFNDKEDRQRVGDIHRCETYEEALEGHKRAVEEVTKKLDGDAIE